MQNNKHLHVDGKEEPSAFWDIKSTIKWLILQVKLSGDVHSRGLYYTLDTIERGIILLLVKDGCLSDSFLYKMKDCLLEYYVSHS